jgi:sugar-specific transcriptional regulator TrmB
MPGQSPDRREATTAAASTDRGLSRLFDADELPRSLTELGLSLNEARLYLALLRLSDGTAAQLARESGVPRPKVYEALGALESRGFCTTVGDRVTRYRPVSADVALRDWIRHRDHERAARGERDQALSETLIRLLPKPEAAGATPAPDYLEAISGRARTTETLEEIIGRAERTVWMLMQPPWLQQRSRWNVAEATAAHRGVQVRVIYSPEAVRDPERIAALMRAGGECRVLPELPMKLLVRDGIEALVSLRDARSGEQTITSVAMRHPDLAKPLGLLFRQLWKKAEPIEEGAL